MSNGWWIAVVLLLLIGGVLFWRGRHGWGAVLIVCALVSIAGTPGEFGMFVRAMCGSVPVGLGAAWDHITTTMGW